jgi:RNA polymerase sigma-70 factor (ECF subfamily)
MKMHLQRQKKGARMFKADTINLETVSPIDENARLVEAAQATPANFKPLYQKWLKPVYRYFYFRVGNEKDAEDLTSQVFLRVYEDLPRYRNHGCFSAWLFAIARARAIDFYRKKDREVALLAAEPLADDLDLFDQTARGDELRQVFELIHQLSPVEQELIRLRFVAELNYREIGSLLHRKEDSVRKAVSRIVERLQMEVNHD